MSEESWPPILQYYYDVADALEREGIKIHQHGFIGNPEGRSFIHDDPSPSSIKLYFVGYYFVACLEVYGDGDLRLRKAALKEISEEFVTYYSVSSKELEENRAPSPQEIAWNLAGALEAFRKMWPKIKEVENKYGARAESIKSLALKECLG